MKSNRTIIIYGPTASGKSDLAEKLAEHMPAEIINMDSAQVYEPLTIGTAKPDWKSSAIKHHLFDCVSQPKPLTVHAYRQMVASSIASIAARGKTPILVGGSGFYLKTLLFELCESTSDPGAQKKVASISPDKLWDRLYTIDPDRAQAIHPHDQYRVKRALEIWFATGSKPSEYQPIYNPVSPYMLVYLQPERQKLYERINERVFAMMDAGWPQEAQGLSEQWKVFARKKGIIGYKYVFAYLNNEVSYQELVAHISKSTRHYAKRQATFWRMLKKSLNNVQKNSLDCQGTTMELDLTYSENGLYIEQLLQRFSTLTSGAV